MRITIGQGRARKVYDLPCGQVFAQAANSKDPDAQGQYRRAHHAICETLGIEHSGRL